MAEVDKRLTANNGQDPRGFQEFTMRPERTTVNIVFRNGEGFGYLDQHSTDALMPLLEHAELKLEVFAETNAIRSTIGRARKSEEAIVRVNININGPESLTQKIGQDMSDRKVWLQHPLVKRYPYHNPHEIKFPGIVHHRTQALEAEIAEPTSQKKQSFEDFQRTVAEVYDTLGRDKDLSRIEGDRRLRTTLLP